MTDCRWQYSDCRQDKSCAARASRPWLAPFEFPPAEPPSQAIRRGRPCDGCGCSPRVHLRLGIDLAGYDRIFTKIGINLCASILGLDLVRSPAFDRAVDYARDGIGAVFKAPAMSEHVLGPPLPDCHVMVLWPAPGGNGSHGIVFMAQLYGGPIERFRLAEFAQPIDGLSEPVVIHVNYQKQRIERLTLEEHVIRVAAIHGDWTTSGSPSRKRP